MVDDKYIKAIKKEFGKQDKKHKHRAVWFAQCAQADIPYLTFEADTAIGLISSKIEESIDGSSEELALLEDN